MAKKLKKPTGIILYEGPSLIDGKPIVVVANTFKGTDNGKIEDMVQTWILRADTHPTDAKKGGEDHSVCGNCKHRPKQSSDDQDHMNTCYVNMMMGPIPVYHAYQRYLRGESNTYFKYDPKYLDMFKSKGFRMGSYGDPAAVPFEVWDKFVSVSPRHTGYTHCWDEPFVDSRLKNICMASADTLGEKLRAIAKGWRTFRVMSDDDTYDTKEISCPASIEAGKVSSCSRCSLCSGADNKIPTTVGIRYHSPHKAVRDRFNNGIKHFKAKDLLEEAS